MERDIPIRLPRRNRTLIPCRVRTHGLHGSVLLCFLFILVSCAAAPEKIQETLSPFDGAQEIALAPTVVCSARVTDTCFVKLGLFKRSTMQQGNAILIVVVDSTNPIQEGESLHFNIGGSVTSLSSIDGKTRYSIGKGPHTAGSAFCESPNCSVKRYLVTKSLLKKLITANEISMRVDLKKDYVGAKSTKKHPWRALPAFREFYSHAFGPV